MPQIIFSPCSHRDLARFTAFLEEVAPEKIAEAIQTIFSKIGQLEKNPLLGTSVPCEPIPNLRKLVIPYKKNGYVALYKYDADEKIIVIETIRHMRELEPEFLKRI